MATSEQLIPIPGRLHSLAPEGHVAGADEIYDDDLQKSQSDINAEVKVMGASGENHSKGLVPDPGATQGNTKYLREDGTWAQPDGQNYTAGDGIDITSNAISVKAGTNLSIDSSGNLNATDTTYSVMGASGSTHASGLVPDTPSTAGTTKFLREDGTWQEVSASPEVQLGGNTPSSESDIKLFVDESADDTVEVYTKAQADGQFVAVVNMNTEPTESTLTYTATDGTTKNFKVGDEIRVPDQDADNGYTFYKLYALTTESSVTTATWDKLGAGGGAPVNPNETVNISLTQIGGNSADLTGAAITITDDDSGDTIYTTTWAGSMITTEVDVNTNYTVSVDTITGYKSPASQSYTAIYQGERNLNFVYAAAGVYIEATDHTLHTSSAWSSANKTANSIVIITDAHSMRMSLTEVALPLNPNTDINPSQYMTVKSTEELARADFDGKGNTVGLLQFNAVCGASTTSYAPTYWRNYVFPDGVTTGAYIMAMGQNRMILYNITAVAACLSACGGAAIGSVGRAGNLWSSTLQGYHSTQVPNGIGMWYANPNDSRDSIGGGYIGDTFGTRGCTDY